MDGAILIVSALDAPLPNANPKLPQRLVAQGTPAQASCADADGDGQPGLVRLAAELQDDRSGEAALVVLEALPGQDVDGSGRYSVLLSVDDVRWTLDVRATLEQARRHRRRRRRGRRR